MSIASGVSEFIHCYYCEIIIEEDYLEQLTFGIRGTYCSTMCAYLEYMRARDKIINLIRERRFEEFQNTKKLLKDMKVTIQK